MSTISHRGLVRSLQCGALVVMIGLLAVCGDRWIETGYTAPQAPAGNQTGEITGVVSFDPGINMSGVTVTLRNASGQESRTVTNTQGRYVFTGLGPGVHTLNFSAIGFKSRQIEISLGAGGRADFDATLESTLPADILPLRTPQQLPPDVSAEVIWRSVETRAALPTSLPRMEFNISPRVGGLDLKLGRGLNWRYDIGTGAAVGLPSDGDTGMHAIVKPLPELDDWIEVTPRPPVVSGTTTRDRSYWAMAPAVSGILPRFVALALAKSNYGPRKSDLLANAKVDKAEQGQAAVPQPRGARGYALDDDYVIDVADAAPLRQVPWGNGLLAMLHQLIEPSLHASQTSAQPAGARPSLKVFLKSLGRSTGENAVQATFINDGNVPIRISSDQVFVMEPLEGVSQQMLDRELRPFAGRKRVTMNLTAYCLDFRKAPPTAGRIYRVATRSTQEKADPVRRVLLTAERLQQWGELHPDGDPNEYFHSIRQWAIWTTEQRFNEQSFAQALLEHTRKNVIAAGRKWDKEIETAARGLIPNRWRDVQHVLAESRRFLPTSAP